VIEWLTICWREGWLGSQRRNLQQAKTQRGYRQAGGLKAYRRRQKIARGMPVLVALVRSPTRIGTGPPILAPPGWI
jgi:hypothetical protein